MRMAQIAGIAVTAAIMLGLDWDVRWLTAFAVFCGALTTYLVTTIELRRTRD